MKKLLKESLGFDSKKPLPHVLSQFSDSELDAYIAIDAATDAMSIAEKELENAIKKLDPAYTVTIAGREFLIPDSRYHDMTVKDMLEVIEDDKSIETILLYLKKKYEGFIGVPFHQVEKETQLSHNQISNYLREVMGTPQLSDKFIPFEEVAEMATWK